MDIGNVRQSHIF